MEYTKGEWTTGKSVMGDWVISTEEELICREVRHYNAHLIAAAPKMYEALKYAQAFCVDVERGLVAVATRDMVRNTIDQAIAKSEGK